MSDHYEDSFDDSFESGSGSESGILDPDEATDGVTIPPPQSRDYDPLNSRSDTLLHVPGGFAIHRVKELSVVSTKGAMSDPDETRTSTLQDEASPKPKKKFKHAFKKPNIVQFKQKIKNKLRKDAPVFGVSLETAMGRSQVAGDGIQLPTVFRECIDYLEENATDHEGLYRLPGVKSIVEEAKSRYDKGEVLDLTDYDVNTVASLFKQYLRDLPEPLIPHRLASRLDALTMLPPSDQCEALEELMDDVPPLEKLMLSWLITHMGHIIDKSSVNKMTLPNIVIVFSPTLQISAPALHTLYNNRHELFRDLELKKYMKPVIEKRDSGRLKVENHLSHVASLKTEEEVTAELQRLTGILDNVHSKMTNRYNKKDDYLWELQRAITILRRKKKALQSKSAPAPKKPMMPPPAAQLPPSNGESEFVRTLMLMEATLVAESEELISKRDELKTALKREVDLIDSYKRRLRNRQSHIVEVACSDEDSGDETDLARQVAALKWHNKELDLRNKNLIDGIQEEGKAIMDLNVKLKIIPIRRQLNLLDETVSY